MRTYTTALRAAVITLTTIISLHATAQNNSAVFSFFQYKGNDERFAQHINPESSYFNPILTGFYPDPSICKKGNDYFMVSSSFAFYPGIPIFHSTDLVNWTQIGHVLNRPEQLSLDSLDVNAGVCAPTIRYNARNRTFYITSTSTGGIGNFIVSSKDPFKGNWSLPTSLPITEGRTPSLFFDNDGKTYLVYQDAPQSPPLYEGHRAIWLQEYNIRTNKTVGTATILIDGGVNINHNPAWIEKPHVYKVNGKYYLLAAEGGKGLEHSEVVFSAEQIKGPYKPAAHNPILTQRDLPDERPNKVISTGQADIIETAEGRWYAVFEGCRPYKGDYYNTGRETFLLPVEWKDDFPVILETGEAVPTIVEQNNLQPPSFSTLTGNFTWRDDFNDIALKPEWMFIRTPRTEWWENVDDNMVLTPTNTTIYDKGNPAFIGRRQQHQTFEVETELLFLPHSPRDIAGLVCFQNERFNILFGKTIYRGQSCLVIDYCADKKQRLVTMPIPRYSAMRSIRLKIKGGKDKYSFWTSFDYGKSWIAVAENVDATILSAKIAGSFTGNVIGIYATGKDRDSSGRDRENGYARPKAERIFFMNGK